jgi:hypothetical protein
MNNSEMPASPVRNCNNEVINLADNSIGSDDFQRDDKNYSIGLSKREHFVAMAMQGIMANEFLVRDKCSKGIAIKAVSIADALLKELSK